MSQPRFNASTIMTIAAITAAVAADQNTNEEPLKEESKKTALSQAREQNKQHKEKLFSQIPKLPAKKTKQQSHQIQQPSRRH